jgi:tripartite ATP-independent transporter DctM subunit
MIHGLVGFAVLFGLLFLSVPIAFGLVAVGFVGFGLIQGWAPALHMVGQIAFSTVLNEEMSVIPLFILMGSFIAAARLSDDLYAAAYALLGHLRGGLSMATVLACAGFSSVCGSSFATAATMSKVALPPMRRYRYADSLATASIAAGATLGVMIPPSVPLLLYGIMTRTDVSDLFVAGVLPGLLGALLYLGAVYATALRNPEAAPPGARVPRAEAWRAIGRVWAVVALFVGIIGGLYFGVFTPTEGAGVGAFLAFCFALVRRGLSLRIGFDLLVDAAKTTGVIMFLLIGALIFSNFLDIAGLPRALADALTGADLPPLAVIVLILAIYLVLGCVLDSMSMLFLTVPLFYPIVSGLGFDLVWFGILVVTMIEVSLITPPVGLNVFVMNAVNPDVATRTIFRGVVPFVIADLARVSLIVAIPAIALFLPNLTK